MKLATLEAASPSLRGRGWDPTGRGPPWECRAARGHQARAEEALLQAPRWGTSRSGPAKAGTFEQAAPACACKAKANELGEHRRVWRPLAWVPEAVAGVPVAKFARGGPRRGQLHQHGRAYYYELTTKRTTMGGITITACVKSALESALESHAARSSTRGGGGASSGLGLYPWECRAARGPPGAR